IGSIGKRISPRPEEAVKFREMFVTVFGLEPAVRTVIPAPLYYSASNVFALTAFSMRAFMVLMPRFDPIQFLRDVEQHHITPVQMVPTNFARLLQVPPETRRRFDTSSLRRVVHAAAPCAVDVKRRMIDWLGPILWEL